MKVTFIGADPRERARPLLDQVLRHGTDQLAIACAFLTGGGVEVLRRHVGRIRQSGSFVVVAWEPPTDLEAVEELHALAPGHIYIHLGSETPVEKRVGPGLMHSKIFYARNGATCRLWTGSHNLTASASQGVNCEAAVVLEGSASEAAFRDALQHIEQCQSEAVVFDPFNPPPMPGGDQTLVIHAERHASVKVAPWFVHLRPAVSTYDRAMRPPAAVWLYLYPPGSLHPGVSRPPAESAFSGTLTALNFTEFHAQRGIPADWNGADYVIEQVGRVFHMKALGPHSSRTPTQGVFRIDVKEDPSTIWLTSNPSARRERIVGETRSEPADPEFLKFFSRRSRDGDHLVHRPYKELRVTYRVPRKEIGPLEESQLVPRLSAGNAKDILIEEKLDAADEFAFIYRAKYRR